MKKMLSVMMLMLFLVFVTSAGAVKFNADNNDLLLTGDVASDDDALPETDLEEPAEQDPDVVDEEPGYVDDEDTDDSQDDEDDPGEEAEE